jgi:hypothetical protein
MLTDPQSITIDGVTTSLPRVESQGQSAKYSSSDGNIVFSVSHQNGKRLRHVIRVDHRKIAADPFRDDQNRQLSTSAYLVIDEPNDEGYDNTELQKIVTGLVTKISASTYALLVSTLAGES